MDDEKLIECVKQHVGLYDLTDKKYVNGSYKQSVWKKIGQQLKQTQSACKIRWNNIRDNYRKSLRRRITKSGLTGQRRYMRYRYEDQLAFLLPFIKDMDPNSLREAHETSTQSESTPINLQPVKDDTDGSCKDKPSTQQADNTIKSDLNTCESASLDVTDYAEDSIASPAHAVDTFLAGIALTLKSLNPYHLNQAKSKIFSVVQEMEMIQIIEQQKRRHARKARSRDGEQSRNDGSGDEFAISANLSSQPCNVPSNPPAGPYLSEQQCLSVIKGADLRDLFSMYS